MAKATISIVGIYNYDSTIFDYFEPPAGVDIETAVNHILLNCAELEILYSDPDFLRQAIGIWSKVESPKWERAFKALNIEYEPLENYNRVEEFTTTDDGEASNTSGGVSTQKGTNETTFSQTGYNSNDFKDATKTTNVPNTETTTDAESQTKTKNTNIVKGTTKGNIGVTTSQQMLEEEIRVSNLSIFDMILESFKKTFCLLIY